MTEKNTYSTKSGITFPLDKLVSFDFSYKRLEPYIANSEMQSEFELQFSNGDKLTLIVQPDEASELAALLMDRAKYTRAQPHPRLVKDIPKQ